MKSEPISFDTENNTGKDCDFNNAQDTPQIRNDGGTTPTNIVPLMSNK